MAVEKQPKASCLPKAYKHKGFCVKKITFPDYSEKSSILAQMYLQGEIGPLEEINGYAASSFYSVDRYISYQRKWKHDLENGVTIIADRYTTSNATHQMGKLPKEEWADFLAWLCDFEYDKLGLPRPDLVIYLDMQPSTSKGLIEKRYLGDNTKKDIHEADFGYLLHCREAAFYAAEQQNWQILKCCDGKTPYDISYIASMVEAQYKRLVQADCE